MDIKVVFAFICLVQIAFGEKSKIKMPDLARLCRLKLYSPENGEIEELLETKPGEFSASFKCNAGYRMIGERNITCKGGNWASRVPWCKSLCNFKTCDEGQKCILGQHTNKPKCVCKNILECPFVHKPICGSDHVTYASSCIMGMTACKKGTEITKLSDGVCPKGLFEDAGCSECPRISICPAFYQSQYGFLGKLKNLNETEDGVYLTFKMLEMYKLSETETESKFITLFKKRQSNECSCMPFVPSGKAYVFGQNGLDSNGNSMHLFDERTYVEKFYGHKQMSLCWLV